MTASDVQAAKAGFAHPLSALSGPASLTFDIGLNTHILTNEFPWRLMVDQQKGRRPVGAIERAFELARQGNFNMVSEIRVALTKEGYDFASQHLSSPTLVRQLRREIAIAKSYEPKGGPKLINSRLRG